MEKSRKRALRRWRSFHAWMRRLQDDWWEHGTRINPRGVYRNWKENNGACSIRRNSRGFLAAEGFNCPCFDFKDNGSYKFKDHPTGNKSRRAEYMSWERDKMKKRDLKRLPVEREKFGKPKKYRKVQNWATHRISCWKCGVLLEIVTLPRDYSIHAYKGKWYGEKYLIHCRACRAKRQARNVLETIS